MHRSIEDRTQAIANYIIENKSKSTVHKDVSDRLKYTNMNLYNQVKEVLEVNKNERHIRGGLATRKKYKG